MRRIPALDSAAFRLFLLANFLGSAGSWMQGTAQGWLVLTLTDSPAALGLVSALQILPILLLSAFAGVVADRVDRRRLLAATQGTSAVLALVLAVLATTGLARFEHVAVLALLTGLAAAIQTPAYQAIVSSLVRREALGSAVALNSAQFNLSRIVGPALAGAAIAAGGLPLAFWANALALVAVAVMLARLPVPRDQVQVEASAWAHLLDGLRHVAADRIVLVLVVLAGVPALFVLNYLLLLPVYARDILAIGPQGLGLLSGAVGLGALAGALTLATVRPGGGSGRAMLAALALASMAVTVFGLSRSLPLSLAALAVLGASQVLYYSTTNTLVQVLVPARLRGRVMSFYILTSWGLMPVGNVIAGWVAEHAGPPVALAGGGLLSLVLAVAVAWRFAAVRRLGVAQAGARPA